MDAHFEGEASRGRKLEGSDPSEPESRQLPFFSKTRGGEKRDLSYARTARKRQLEAEAKSFGAFAMALPYRRLWKSGIVSVKVCLYPRQNSVRQVVCSWATCSGESRRTTVVKACCLL